MAAKTEVWLSGGTEAKEAGRGTDTRPAPRSSTSALLHPTQKNPKLVLGRHGLRSISPATSSARFAAKISSAVCSRCRKPKAWPERGAAWVLAALEDVVGSVASHSARKAAAAAGPGRPSTAGSRPGTAQRPATGTQGRHQFQPPVRPQEGTVPSKQTERLRLLGIKHFVAAAKADDDLQNCQLVATCLADVAMGLAPHLESDDLMALERLAFENMKISWWDGTVPLKEGRISDPMDSRTEDSNLDSPSSDRVREQSEVPAMAAEEEEVRGSEGYVLNRAEHLLKCLMDGESGSNQGETEMPGGDQSFRTLSRHVQDSRQFVQQATSLPGVCEGPLQFDSGLPPPRRIIHRVFVREFNAEGDEVEHVEPDSGDDVFTGGTAIA
ncbi:unnamed protein product [Symbiodinium sp. CCMP2592]|nr:unnamed protein product [Symbiodinium sp. CCMP2592]